MNSKEMRKVANRVRKRLEKIATMLHSYTSPHLGGLCGYGSLMLHEELTQCGRSPQVATGCGHWFVVCDGFLVDVTASQFGQPKVVVRDYEHVKEDNENNAYNRSYWNASALGTPQDAGIGGLKSHLDKTMKTYKERKHVVHETVATPMGVSLGEVSSYVLYAPANYITVSPYTVIDASKKV